LTFIGTNLTFLPMHSLGLHGMPRRIALYDPQFESLNKLCTYGAMILGFSVVPFFINMVWSWGWGPEAGRNPWRSLTLEWQTTSPPAIENFDEDPIVWAGPYDYGVDTQSFDDADLSVEEMLQEVGQEMN
jgi:cytochrome c oxidase subunit 1